jgi:hypothetical protein
VAGYCDSLPATPIVQKPRVRRQPDPIPDHVRRPPTPIVQKAGSADHGIFWTVYAAQRSFLVADGLGGLAAITEVVVAGFVLGEAYERAGVWLTVVGSLIAIGLLVASGRR